MRIGIDKICGIIILQALLCCSTIKKGDFPTKFERQNLLSKTFIVRLPFPFYSQKDNYEEGVIYYMWYYNSASFIVLFHNKKGGFSAQLQ